MPAPTQSRAGSRPSGWRPLSVAIITLVWAVLYLPGILSPGLLDDVDSVYLEAAREMMLRHDYVTPFVDGIRFFDKPPLPFWLAAGSMHLFGAHVWAARLPLALFTLALLFAVYALGLRLLASVSPAHAPDRAALLSALVVATSLGPYLYTRFYIPDIPLVLWMTLSIHLFLTALARAEAFARVQAVARIEARRPTLPVALCLGTVLALGVLTKGLIGLALPVLFMALFLAVAKPPIRLRQLHLPATAAAFVAIAAPWHLLAALRNPPIPMPPLAGLPPHAGWTWFYLVNEHLARFFSRRIPHDYGQVPVLLFWLLTAVWLAPWVAFLPAALATQIRSLRRGASDPGYRPALVLLLWSGVVLAFFTLSARQEYYSLPAIPAMALAVGALLARADTSAALSGNARAHADQPRSSLPPSIAAPANARLATARTAERSVLRVSAWLLAPAGTLAAVAALLVASVAPHPPPGTDIATLLSPRGGPYDLSLDHIFDLTFRAMGAFRLPLCIAAISLIGLGPGTWLLRRARRTIAANAVLTASAVLLLLAVHAGLERFYPVLGSRDLAAAILRDQREHPSPPPETHDLILLDGELTTGSSLLFYTAQPVSMLDARVNGPWFGSLWPDAPPVFESAATLPSLWAGKRRVYLLTRHARERLAQLRGYGPASLLASSGGKAILVNRARPAS